MPQAPDRKEERSMAIHSPNIYVDWSTEFVALCPNQSSRDEYITRGWTNIEMVCALVPVVKHILEARSSHKKIWGGTTDRVGFLSDVLQLQPVTTFKPIPPSLRKFTFASDINKAVEPIINAVMQQIAKCQDFEDKYVGSVNLGPTMETLRKFLEHQDRNEDSRN
jgi:hypothetical protein